MSSQTEIDYDKQFQDDLEKATALSLETLALEEFRRSKLQYSHSDAAVCPNKYAQNPTRLRPGSFNAGTRLSDSQSSIAPPPAVPPRRHSEVRLPSEKTEDSDLISFASPTSAKKDESINFDKLIEDIQRLNTQAQHVNQQQQTPHYGFGSTPSLLAANQSQTMQLVPYNAPPAQKPALTSEQLSQLYSMQPQMPFRNPYQHHVSQYIRPQSAAVPIAPFNYPQPPTYGFQMHLFPSQQGQQLSTFPQLELPNQSNPQSFTVNSEQPAVVQAPQVHQYQASAHQILQISKSASVSGVSTLSSSVTNCTPQPPSGSTNSTASTDVVRRPKKSVGCDDLIDLGHEDNSRVSVLEAFDPLLCKDWDDTDTFECNRRRPTKKVRFR